jgi:hypothetical protein
MCSPGLLLALFLQISQVSAAPGDGKEVCLASGVSGSPLSHCLLEGKFTPLWSGKQPQSEKQLRAWADRRFPVESEHVGWTLRGEKRSTRVTSHHFDGDLGVPIVEFDQKLALVSSGPLDLRVLPSAPGALTANERSSLATEAQRLWARAIKSRLPDEPVENRFELQEPQVLGVPGTPGLRTVLFPMSFEFGRVKDSRGSFFFLIDHSGKITFGRFGHVEWSPRASDEDAKFEPLFFFRIGAEPRTYLLTNYSGPWESWGLVAIIDPTRAQVVSN